MTHDSIGIDISKRHFDAHRLTTGIHRRFDNTAAGFKAFGRWLGTGDPGLVVFEPTGPYHRDFEAAFTGRLPLVKVNPLQARRFAQSQGTRAKTDAVDAHMRARMGRALELAPDRPAEEIQIVLRDLRVARSGLVRDRTALMNRLARRGCRSSGGSRRRVLRRPSVRSPPSTPRSTPASTPARSAAAPCRSSPRSPASDASPRAVSLRNVPK